MNIYFINFIIIILIIITIITLWLFYAQLWNDDVGKKESARARSSIVVWIAHAHNSFLEKHLRILHDFSSW